MLRRLLLPSLLVLSASAALPEAAQAQMPGGFTLRAGADIKPLVYAGDISGTIADPGVAYVGINVAPGYKLLPMLTAELALTARIPLDGQAFSFLMAPGAIIDLYIVYIRGAFPIELTGVGDSVYLWLQAAAGISFLTKGYLGLVIDYVPASKTMTLGAEVGFRF
ncbi:MAG: hypothetical protein IT384_02520 [Deltaproteobacteria bacterium]|nr:hypothetical protein [Deltaproteobacteria bacterium]